MTCCQGHYQAREVGPGLQCGWEYLEHGQQSECPSSDQIVVGRCGSGMNRQSDSTYSHWSRSFKILCKILVEIMMLFYALKKQFEAPKAPSSGISCLSLCLYGIIVAFMHGKDLL